PPCRSYVTHNKLANHATTWIIKQMLILNKELTPLICAHPFSSLTSSSLTRLFQLSGIESPFTSPPNILHTLNPCTLHLYPPQLLVNLPRASWWPSSRIVRNLNNF